MVMYLVGAISFELGDVEKAAQYLGRMVNDNDIRTSDPKLMDRIKDLWTEVREQRAAEQTVQAKKNPAGAAKPDAASEKRASK